MWFTDAIVVESGYSSSISSISIIPTQPQQYQQPQLQPQPQQLSISKNDLEEWWQREYAKRKPLDPSYFAYTGYRCYYCEDYETDAKDKNKKKSGYENHVKSQHGSDLPLYPNKAEIEKLGLKAQGKSWEI
jgi:hypothetical protein